LLNRHTRPRKLWARPASIDFKHLRDSIEQAYLARVLYRP
jgi:hypothetical protein